MTLVGKAQVTRNARNGIGSAQTHSTFIEAVHGAVGLRCHTSGAPETTTEMFATDVEAVRDLGHGSLGQPGLDQMQTGPRVTLSARRPVAEFLFDQSKELLWRDYVVDRTLKVDNRHIAAKIDPLAVRVDAARRCIEQRQTMMDQSAGNQEALPGSHKNNARTNAKSATPPQDRSHLSLTVKVRFQ
ncbi:hypothetical protein PQR53_37785 [Paraburkholderia fungorum]